MKFLFNRNIQMSNKTCRLLLAGVVTKHIKVQIVSTNIFMYLSAKKKSELHRFTSVVMSIDPFLYPYRLFKNLYQFVCVSFFPF